LGFFFVGSTKTGRRRRFAGARVHNTHTYRDASTRESGEINQESTSAKGGVEKNHICMCVSGSATRFSTIFHASLFRFFAYAHYCFVFFSLCFLTQYTYVYFVIISGFYFLHTLFFFFSFFLFVGYITHWISGFTLANDRRWRIMHVFPLINSFRYN